MVNYNNLVKYGIFGAAIILGTSLGGCGTNPISNSTSKCSYSSTTNAIVIAKTERRDLGQNTDPRTSTTYITSDGKQVIIPDVYESVGTRVKLDLQKCERIGLDGQIEKFFKYVRPHY